MEPISLIKPNSVEECKKLLINCSEISNDMQAVIVLILNNDGSQELFTSKASPMEKSFLTCFLNSYMSNWFKPERVE